MSVFFSDGSTTVNTYAPANIFEHTETVPIGLDKGLLSSSQEGVNSRSLHYVPVASTTIYMWALIKLLDYPSVYPNQPACTGSQEVFDFRSL